MGGSAPGPVSAKITGRGRTLISYAQALLTRNRPVTGRLGERLREVVLAVAEGLAPAVVVDERVQDVLDGRSGVRIDASRAEGVANLGDEPPPWSLLNHGAHKSSLLLAGNAPWWRVIAREHCPRHNTAAP